VAELGQEIMKNDLAIVSGGGKALARPSAKAGLAAINSPLEEIVGPLDVAVRCERFMAEQREYLGGAEPLSDRYLDRARQVHASLLPNVAVVDEAYTALCKIIAPRHGELISYGLAVKMLSMLFGALSKRKSDDADENARAVLAACAEMFDPISDSIGASTGFWKPLPKNPAVLALAVKKLLVAQIFTPSPCELRGAMREVHERINRRAGSLVEFLSLLNRADQTLFAFDRAAWAEHYVHVNAAAVLVMATTAEYADDDDDRARALDQLFEAKHEADEASRITHAAACTTAVAKRTRKPKRPE
jgi:hypothetical protein